MSDIPKIDDYVTEGLDLLREQWKGKENLSAAIASLIAGDQELEDVFFQLCNERLDLDVAVGEQLDQYGAIVGQARLNFDDDFYRILIRARIGINISNGEPERIIETAKLLTSATNVHYLNIGGAELDIGSDGVINPLSVDFLLINLGRVVMGGVRVNNLCIYDPDEAFAIDGGNTISPGAGFGTLSDPLVGGKFGQCYNIKNKFSFDGNNTGDEGFGTIQDPLVGGVFE